MGDLMTFPDTVEEFMEEYKIIDTEQVYTNGAELVPIFRMKQWFEHLPTSEPKKGKWVAFVNEGGELDLKCSICSEEQGFYFCYFNYCPNCGAKMEET